MRIWMGRGIALILVMALMLQTSMVFATEPVEPETVPAETVQETVPVETQPEATEEAPTEPAPTEPEPTEPYYVVDTEAAIYDVCKSVADGMSYDQLLVFDATNDKILYSDTREGSKLYPASVTKLFSAYVALQHLDAEEVITVGDEMDLVHAGSSIAYLAKGQKIYARNVVEGMMLPSGNDAAIVLATAAGRRIAGNEQLAPEEAVHTFVQEMNRKAQELGFERTHFANPDGWHAGSHYTCLNDMARIAKLALDDSVISRYIRRHEDEVYFPSGHLVNWTNTNLLLDPEEGYYRSNAIGMKTGYTRQAEYCLMAAYKCTDGRNLVIGVFGYEDTGLRFQEANRMAKACNEQFKLEAKAAKEAAKKAK